MRYENGQMIDMELIISRVLEHESHVFVILKEDLAMIEADSMMINGDGYQD